MLLDAAWGSDAESGDRTVDTHIKTLRAKLKAALPDLDPIETHRGLGYSVSV
jgi:two-component system catabolic regulation response regulator CreB